MAEIWKDVPGYEDVYQVSSKGRLRSKDRYRQVCGGGHRFIEGQIIKPMVCSNGYLEACLVNNRVRKVKLLHRLVAEIFIPNPDGLPEVNHKDENPSNCSVENLEWCTSKYNANYGSRNQRSWENNPQKVAVNQFTLNGDFITKYSSIGEAAIANKADVSSIIKVCQGKQKTCRGYKWQYANKIK